MLVPSRSCFPQEQTPGLATAGRESGAAWGARDAVRSDRPGSTGEGALLGQRSWLRRLRHRSHQSAPALLRPPTWAGLVYGHSSATLWWAFACERHVAHLYAPRCLLDRDRAELERRRAEQERALAGHSFQRTEPLATGAAAKRLLRRAIAYHDHHKDPLDTGGRPSDPGP